MGEYERARFSTYALSGFMILIGVILILIEKLPAVGATTGRVLEFTGTTLVGVFAVTLIYEAFVAEKHFADFRNLLTSELKEMDQIQSKCKKLGIREIFETRNAYELMYPLSSIVQNAPEDTTVTCVARSLFLFLLKSGDLRAGLHKGLTFHLACVDPDGVTPIQASIGRLLRTDIESALRDLRSLVDSAVREKAKGAIELRFHHAEVLDSATIFTMAEKGEKLAWDLCFGRDATMKKVMVVDTASPLGRDLKKRYLAIYDDATRKLSYSKGQIVLDDIS